MSRNFNKRINNSEPGRKWFWSLTGLLFLSLFSYGYLVQGAIVNIVERQNMEKGLVTLNSKVINLESEYLKAKNDITLERAQNLGFVTVSTQKFVTKNTNRQELSVLVKGI